MAESRQFEAVPQEQDLTKFDRDLHFYPSKTTDPKYLSLEQINQFNQDGYLRGLQVFNDQEVLENRLYFDRLLETVIAAGGDSYSISTAHMQYGKVYDLLTHPEIISCVRDLLGENVIGWGSHFFCKMPHDGKSVAWHQDASYWPLTPSKAVTVWLAIDDADPENANMKFIAGSHHHGHMTYRPSGKHEDNVLNQTIENPEQYGMPVDDSLKAGEASIHSDLLLHGSDANESNRRRCGLTLRYCTADVRAGMDWNAKGVIVSGEDASGHWLNPARPEND